MDRCCCLKKFSLCVFSHDLDYFAPIDLDEVIPDLSSRAMSDIWSDALQGWVLMSSMPFLMLFIKIIKLAFGRLCLRSFAQRICFTIYLQWLIVCVWQQEDNIRNYDPLERWSNWPRPHQDNTWGHIHRTLLQHRRSVLQRSPSPLPCWGALQRPLGVRRSEFVTKTCILLPVTSASTSINKKKKL